MNEDGEGFDTRALHAGEEGDPWSRAVTSPLILSTNFRTSPDESSFSAHAMKEGDPYFYSRWGTPTVRALERKLAALEGAEDAVCFASGMGAAASFLLHRLKAGDHLVLSDVCYAGVPEFAFATLPKLGVEVTAADFSDVSEIERAIRPNTKVIWAESPCNPIFRLTDLAAVSKVAKGAGADFLVDSTIATPLYTRPLELGADFVMHSLTKYLNGHGDALGGVILGKAEDIQALRKDALIHLGAVLSPFNAWLIMRGVHTLAPRMRVHSENALQVAAFLEGHRAVKRVIYPGLPSHPQHQLAKRQMAGFSGMLSFQVNGDGLEVARHIARHARVFSYAVSLGKQKSLVIYLPTADLLASSFRISGKALESYRGYAGDGVFRVSVGLENPQDLCAELDRLLTPFA